MPKHKKLQKIGRADDTAYVEAVERGDMSCSVDDIIYDGLISKPDMRLTDIYDTIKTEDRANAFEAAGDKNNAARERRRERTPPRA